MYSGRNLPVRIISAPLSGAGVAMLRPGALRATRDLGEFGGAYRCHGDVKQVGTPDAPVWRRVRLFSRRDGRLVREVWSDPVTGAYSFDWISPAHEYTLVAYDHTGTYQAAISDVPTLDPMP